MRVFEVSVLTRSHNLSWPFPLFYGSCTILLGSRVRPGLGVQSGCIPDLEEKVPSVPVAESLPPETLDHVVCTFKRTIGDGEQYV